MAPREEAASIVSGAGNATPRSWEVHKEAKTEQNGGHLPEPELPEKIYFYTEPYPPLPRERTTRVGRPRGGMKVAARSGERLRKVGRGRLPRVGDG